jgi:WD40 repeat protein
MQYSGNTLAWSPDGKYIASGGRDGCLILWDVKKGRSLKTFKLVPFNRCLNMMCCLVPA